MVVVVGDTRLKAARTLGLAEVPVHVAENLSPDQCRAYRLMDNRSNEEAEWDFERLAEELRGLEAVQFPLEFTGFDERELQRITFAGPGGVMGRQDYHWRHEPILYGWKPGAAHSWASDRTQDTVWEIPRPKRSVEHPTMKPVELVSRAIVNSSKPGDLVLDPFGSSGSTLIACEAEGRVCRMAELDPRYVDVIVERWETFTGRRAELVHEGTAGDGDGRAAGEGEGAVPRCAEA